MRRKFNTAGPMMPERHYMLPPLGRIDLEKVSELISDLRYFVLHAPRQTGKTSLLVALRDLLNRDGSCRCLYFNVELGRSARGNVEAGMKAILGVLATQAEMTLQDSYPQEVWCGVLSKFGGHAAFHQLLIQWARRSDKPLVLLIDEIDSLVGDTLIAILRQLRVGYEMRPTAFPASVILCGLRDVRDYRIDSDASGESVTGGSAFNIKAASLRLGDFVEEEIRALLGQHTADTGQSFTDAALAAVWRETRGQP